MEKLIVDARAVFRGLKRQNYFQLGRGGGSRGNNPTSGTYALNNFHWVAPAEMWYSWNKYLPVKRSFEGKYASFKNIKFPALGCKFRILASLRVLRPWQTKTHCCGHIVARDVSWAAQTGKHLLRTQNVFVQNQKHFLCPGHKICVRNKCCARGQTGKHLCRQQCVRNNVSSFARAFMGKTPL